MQNVTKKLKTIFFLRVQRFFKQPNGGHQHFQETPVHTLNEIKLPQIE